MDDKKQELYRLTWSQDYDMTSLPELMDELALELALELSELKEAKEVIANIKSKL